MKIFKGEIGMNEANKKKVTRIQSVILMVLAAVMLVVAFTPAITIKTGNLVFRMPSAEVHSPQMWKFPVRSK